MTGIASAVPGDVQRQDDLWTGFFSDHYGGSELAQRVFANAGVETRHGVVDPTREDISAWSTGERMARFVQEAMPLGDERRARRAHIRRASSRRTSASSPVVSCTGYATPGLDILLARDLGMSADVQRLHVGTWGATRRCPAWPRPPTRSSPAARRRRCSASS
jgi:predicted naringenin-chalcone synthase